MTIKKFLIKEKFSKQIRADEDGYYMSCPEEVSKFIAKKISKFNSAVELCCAVGMTSIQIAKRIEKVIGIDLDKKRIENAKFNAKLYGVDDKVDFIVGDVLDSKLLKSIDVDVAILDPDWSKEGAEKTDHAVNIDETQPSMREMFNLTKKYITKNILIRIPKNFNTQTLSDLGNPKITEIYWDDKLRFKLAWFF